MKWSDGEADFLMPKQGNGGHVESVNYTKFILCKKGYLKLFLEGKAEIF